MATKTSSKDTIKLLKQAAHKFRIYGAQIDIDSKAITSAVAEELAHEIRVNYSIFKSGVAAHDHQDRSGFRVITEPSARGNKITVLGKEIIYDEFGTGIEGFNNPHPDKHKYSLNAYNTGASIKHFSDSSRDYWIYYNNGKFWSTHGVPSGHFVYDSFMNVADGMAAKIALDEMLKLSKKNLKGK